MGAALSETTSSESTSADSSEAEQLPADAVVQDAASDTDGVDYKALYEKYKSLSRKHEDRAKANAQAASKARTVEEQLSELQKETSNLQQKISDGEAAALVKSGRLAVTQVQAKLASSGFKPDDVSGFLDLIPPSSLLRDGEPDDAAIEKLAKSLIKAGGRVTPDPDQGRRGGNVTDMNSIIRRAAGYQS